MEKGCSFSSTVLFFLHGNCVTETVLRVKGPGYLIHARTRKKGRRVGGLEGIWRRVAAVCKRTERGGVTGIAKVPDMSPGI